MMGKDEFMKRMAADLDIGELAEREIDAEPSESPEPQKAEWKKADYSQIRDLYDAGKTDVEIAAEANVGKSTVYRWRQENGLSANGRKRRAAPPPRDGGKPQRPGTDIRRMVQSVDNAAQEAMFSAVLESTQGDLVQLAIMTLEVLKVIWDKVDNYGGQLPPIE